MINLLVFILRVLESSSIPGALGWAIVILSIIVRFAIWPLMSTQLRSAKKMMELKPKVDELKLKHKGDKQAFATAQMALYKEHGVNPAGGCLPILIQMPFFIALLQAISAFFNNGNLDNVNNYLYLADWKLAVSPSPYFLGLDLAAKPSEFLTQGYVLLLVPIITALLQFIQSKMMAPKSHLKITPKDTPKEVKQKEDVEDAMSAMQGQMTYVLPLVFGVTAFQFPTGLALYFNAFSLIGIWQQYLVSGWGGLESWVNKLRKV